MIQQMSRTVFALTALLSFALLQANHVTPTLVYRSQGFHADRQRNVGEVGKIHLMDAPEWYHSCDVAVGYMRSFDRDEIAHCLFGNDIICNDGCRNTIKVQGSSVADRDPKAWLADYFYLNCAYDGSFSINPLIQNVVIDLDFYLDLGEWVEGSYVRLYGPINWTKWETRFCVSDPATVLTSSCSTGYFTPSGDEVLLSSLADYFKGEAPAGINRVVFKPLKYAKMPICDETKWGFAELRAELGYNFWQNEDYHLGVGAHVAAPTGNKRRAEYVMSPVIGNGNHWEVGGTVHGHYVCWRSDDEEKQCGFYVDAIVTHLFRATEQRTFDLCCKDNSRYMLASRFNHSITGGTNGLKGTQTAGNTNSGGAVPPNGSEFDYAYAPVANLTTTDVKVSIGAQFDLVALFNFQYRKFSWDLGYNFWTRSCESIECPRECNPCNPDSIFNTVNQNRWALKGDARMFGFAGSGATPIVTNDEVPLSATQSKATIHAGTNAGFTDATLTSVSLQNGGVDNSYFAVTGASPIVLVIHTPTTQGGINNASNQIKTSIEPIYLRPSDVALQETKGLSHKVFTHLSYNWNDREWNPYLGIGGSGEWGRTDCSDCTNCCSSTCTDNCVKCSLSQWSIWIKGGVSFD